MITVGSGIDFFFSSSFFFFKLAFSAPGHYLNPMLLASFLPIGQLEIDLSELLIIITQIYSQESVFDVFCAMVTILFRSQ